MKLDRDSRIEESQLRIIRHANAPARLLGIWRRSPYVDVRAAAIHKLQDQAALSHIACRERVEHLRCEAVRKLRDRALLAVIAETDESVTIRHVAYRKLADRERWDPADMDEDAAQVLVMILEHSARLDCLGMGQEAGEDWW
jgi:uncharacterized DUF497 family protein